MNWDAVGAVSEGLGSIAVFVTLGYLAVQVRHVRGQMSMAANQARWDALRDIQLAAFANPEYLECYDKMQQSFAAAAEVDTPTALTNRLIEHGATPRVARQFNHLQWAFWFYREQGILYISELTPGQRVQFDHAIRNMLPSWTPERAWYEAWKPTLNPDVVRYIDTVLAQPG